MDIENEIDSLMERLGKELLEQGGRPAKQVAFDAALSFHDGAKRCAEPRPTGVENQIQSPTAPMICCYAFACELYLKSILKHGKDRGHDLSILFNRLDLKEKNLIALEYEKLTGRDKTKLKQDIDAFANAFVEWRYLHEKGKVRLAVHRLAQFALSLFRFVRSIHPEWEVKAHTLAWIEHPLPDEILGQISMGGGIQVRAVMRRNRG